MVKVALRGMVTRKLRTALTALAIVLGLAFIGFALWWRKKRRRGEV